TKNGICLGKDYPYTSGKAGLNGECQSTCKKQKLAIDKYSWAVGEDKLEKALNTQPVIASVEAGNYAWMFYKSGVVMACPGNDYDHSALVVGYGSEIGVNFFKLRNSWGLNWGDKGYIKLLRGVGDIGTCRVAEYPLYPKIVGTPAPTTKPAC
ncbi:cysteine protease family C01A, partial [Thraustotheca clavata]